MIRITGQKTKMVDYRRLKQNKWLIPLALLLLSLTVYFAHFLTAPPGLNGDAARLGLYTFDFLQEGLFPFYIYHQFAPNPLIIYLQAPVFTLWGYTPAALRGVTLVGGALAVPALYLAARQLFGAEDTLFGWRVGLVAALGLALSPFFASFSRYGFEVPLLPVVELLAVAFLWRGLRRGLWLDFALAGIVVGLSQYVYIVARFFPLAVGVATLSAIGVNRHLFTRWRGLVVAAFCAAGVALPQWVLFWYTPYTFIARTQQAAGQFIFDLPDPLPLLIAKLINQVRMLGWYWDNAYDPYSYQALLTPVLMIGLVVGLGLTFYQRRAAYIFSLVIMLLMLLPDLLAYEGIEPSATRLVPALPFIFIMAGLGSAYLWGWLEKQPSLPRWAGYLLPLVVILWGLLRQWDYTTRVIPQVQATPGLEWRASLVELAEAEYIAAHLDTPLLLPSSEYQRAPLTYLLAEHFPQRAGGLPLPLSQNEAITVIQPLEPDRPTTEGIPSGYIPEEWVLLKAGTAYFLPPLPDSIKPLNEEPTLLKASNNVAVARAFPARWQGVAPEYTPLPATFANGLNLVGYQAAALTPGQPLLVTFYWQPTQKIEEDVQIFVQLLNRQQEVVAGLHSWPLHGAFRVRAWPPGEIMPVSYRLPLPDPLPSGTYQLLVGTFDLIQQKRIPLTSGAEYQLSKTFKVSPPPDNRTPTHSTAINFGDSITLTGYTLSPSDNALTLVSFWQARATPQTDYTLFIHVVDAAGQIVAQADAQPLAGQYPTSLWNPGETVVDEQTIPIPPGEYQIYVGWYQGDTLARLPISADQVKATDDRLWLETLNLP